MKAKPAVCFGAVLHVRRRWVTKVGRRGIYGHCDQSDARGPGDPGQPLRDALITAGYTPVNVAGGTDITSVSAIQRELGARGARITIDGVYGLETFAAVRQYGGTDAREHTGQWVERPGD